MTGAMTGRVHLVAALALLLALGLGLRLGYLQVHEGQFLQRQGDARSVRMERINATRGLIHDRHGKPLAVSTPVLSLWANPRQALKDDGWRPLAAHLGIAEDEFLARMKRAQDRSFVYLRRHLPPSEARAALALKAPGVHAQREYRRFYPAGEVASHLVGFTDIDDHGQEGVERTFDAWLAGTPGKKQVLKNLHGEIFRDVRPVAEAIPGRNLALTIDLRLQYLAYRELKSAVAHFRADSGSCVLLDAATGQVLALVNQPSYNPNNRVGLDLDAIRNRALTDAFEPGSTVKPFTVVAALSSGRYAPETLINTSPGSLQVGSFIVVDPSDQGRLSLSDVLAYSSQVGISRLALDLNAYEVWHSFEKLGFGQPTGVGFPGEASGSLPNRRHWSDLERVTFAYGYGLAVTPLQLAAAYLPFAAGGMKPEVKLALQVKARSERVLPRQMAQQVKRMLAEAVRKGTGRQAAIDGYTVAGKTGTVRKLGEEGYQDNAHIVFFAGFAPVERPRLVSVVMINGARAGRDGGGAIAAPVFSRIMSAALRMLNVIPDDARAA